MDYPGNGSILLSQTINYNRPVYINDYVRTEVEVSEIVPEKRKVLFDFNCMVENESDEPSEQVMEA